MSRGQEKAIWERFRAACDKFFTRRHADLAERKTMWAENLAKKEALCVKVEALPDSTDWEPTPREIKRLQAEWKTIGPVKKTRSEAMWQRFRGACDASSPAMRSATTSRAANGSRRGRRLSRSWKRLPVGRKSSRKPTSETDGGGGEQAASRFEWKSRRPI